RRVPGARLAHRAVVAPYIAHHDSSLGRDALSASIQPASRGFRRTPSCGCLLARGAQLPRVKPLPNPGRGEGDATMNALGIILAIIAIILLFTGGFVQTLNFLLWVGIVLLVIAAIVFLMRFISGRRV